MELVRNCTHSGSTYIFFETDSEQNIWRVIKTSFNKDGIDCISREYAGICWYCSRLSLDPKQEVSLRKTSGYARIEISYHPGEVGLYTGSLRKNEKKIKNSIDYYYKTICMNRSGWRHGDYVVNNIVFHGDEVAWVIDWESFNNILPEWFDCFNCIMETVFFTYKRTSKLSESDRKIMFDLIRYLGRYTSLPPELLEKPVTEFRKWYLQYGEAVFGDQRDKYPFINSSREDLVRMESFLTR